MTVHFFQRAYPSANVVLLAGPDPVLVDTGFGSDVPALLDWLGPARPALIVNTHHHSDHVGGNHALQLRFGAAVAIGAAEAERIEACDPDACDADWLHQPIERFSVQRRLEPGDVIDTGETRWTVLATPGHTEGHLSLFCRENRVAVLGDALHEADLGWLSPREPDALAATEATLARLAELDLRRAYSGHGAVLDDPAAALARGRRRVASWRSDPRQIGWHACKRIFTHALMLEDGIDTDAVAPFLLALPWFRDHAVLTFGVAPEAFVGPLLDEMVRAGAAAWDGGRLRPCAAYAPPKPGWSDGPTRPQDW